jgi:hypothetical protein
MLMRPSSDHSFPATLLRPRRLVCRNLPALAKLVSEVREIPETGNRLRGRQVRGMSYFIYVFDYSGIRAIVIGSNARAAKRCGNLLAICGNIADRDRFFALLPMTGLY